MNRNEAIEFLKRNVWGTAVEGWNFDITNKWYRNGIEPCIRECHLVVRAESLQSRIETLLDMKFDTESTLLAAIGSLWGDNYRREVQELATPHRIESDTGPLDTLKRLVHPVTVTVNNYSDSVTFSTEDDKEGHVTVTIQDTPRPVVPPAAYRVQPVKTYRDGVEPLRVGHIVEQGVVEAITGTKSCIRNHSDELVLVRTSNLKPHPFAKYTEVEREFLQAQIEAGVIKLC